jgi:hypothetical protein
LVFLQRERRKPAETQDRIEEFGLKMKNIIELQRFFEEEERRK